MGDDAIAAGHMQEGLYHSSCQAGLVRALGSAQTEPQQDAGQKGAAEHGSASGLESPRKKSSVYMFGASKSKLQGWKAPSGNVSV